MKRLLAVVLACGVGLFVSSSYAYNCSGVAQFSAGSVNTGDIRQNGGSAYRCDVGGWCSLGGPYEPGVGWAWTYAWTGLGTCDGGGSSSGGSSSGGSSSGGSSSGGSSSGGSSSGGSSSGGSSSGSCAGLPTWNASSVYTGGNQVQYNSTKYQAKWWTQGDNPAQSGQWGVWSNLGACSGGSSSGGSSSGGSSSGGSSSGGSSSGGSSGGLGSILSRSAFESMFPNRNAIFTYDALISAAASYPAFGTAGSSTQRLQEVAAFFGNIGHETTGGWPTAPGGPQAWGLYFAQEVGCEGGACTGYCVANTQYACVAGQTYHGRGPIQLSYNYNYGPAGQALGINLLSNPSLVATDGAVSFKTALWFWMTAQPPKPSAHAVMTGGWTPTSADIAAGRQPGFGMTINIINGGLECGPGRTGDARVADRVAYYQRAANLLGTSIGSNVYCDTMQHY